MIESTLAYQSFFRRISLSLLAILLVASFSPQLHAEDKTTASARVAVRRGFLDFGIIARYAKLRR